MGGAAFRTLLLDIEGTIAPITFVTEVMFPYARREMEAFLAARWDDPEVGAVRGQIARDADVTDFSRQAIVPHLHELMDRDAKATGLKALQGLIWENGFADGTLRAPLFPDVAPTLRSLHARGVDLRIYSSGSIAAQKLFLAHTTDGDLTPLFSGHYDTATGPKQQVESYRRIVADVGCAADVILFASDVVAELDAARAAGMQTRLALRPGNRPVGEAPHERFESLAEI